MHHVPFILTLTIGQTTTAAPNCSFHQCRSVHPPAASMCTHKVQALTSTACSINNTELGTSTSIPKVSSFISQTGCLTHSMPLFPDVNSFFPFQMAALNFECILLMLKDMGSILRDTLQSQDGLNLGDIRFCPLIRMLHMQCLSLKGLHTLLTEGMFMPPQSERPPELSRTAAILLVFQVDSRYEKITNIYVGLVVCHIDSHLYNPDQVLDFIKDIEGDLQAVHDTLKARHNPGKRHVYCLFVDNLSSTMSVPTDPPYCLVYPTSYFKGIKLDHFNTCNSPAGSACIVVYAAPPCSSAMMIPKSVLNTSGVASSCPTGHSTMISYTPLFQSHRTTAAR